MLPLPPGRLEGAVLPGRRGVARRRRVARRAACSSRTCAATCASSPSTAAPREAERARRLLLVALRLRGVRLPRRARPHVPRGRALARLRIASARCAVRTLPSPLPRCSALGVARLLPDTGFGLWLRLAAATRVPAPARRARRARRSGAERLGRARLEPRRALRGALAVMFAVHASLDAGARAARCRRRCGRAAVRRAQCRRRDAGAARSRVTGRGRRSPGVGLGIALWCVDGHLDRRRRPLPPRPRAEARRLRRRCSLRAVDEFRDGGLHPGYAFPLWHAFLALVARLAGVDPTRGRAARGERARAARVRSSPASRARRSSARPGAALAVLLAQVGAVRARRRAAAASYTALALPATASRQLLVPGGDRALLRVRRATARGPGCATLAAAPARARARPPDVRALRRSSRSPATSPRGRCSRGRELRRGRGRRSPRSSCPAGAVALWLRPIVARDRVATTRRRPSCARALEHYSGQLDVFSRRQLPARAGGASARSGRGRGRGARSPCRSPRSPPGAAGRAFVLGGFVAVLALDARAARSSRTSPMPSRSRRRGAPPASSRSRSRSPAARPCSRGCSRLGALPVGARRRASRSSSPTRATSATRSTRAGPALATWIALVGGAAALVVGDRPAAPARPSSTAWAPIAAATAALVVLPVAVHGFTHWDERPDARHAA